MTGRNPEKPKKKRGHGGFLLTAALLLVLIRAALYDGLTVRTYTVTSPLVSGAHTYALVTDLHSTVYGREQEELAEKIRQYSPEAVFFAGDIADDERDFAGTAFLLEKLADLDCRYVTGNHERWVKYSDDIRGLFASFGVNVLGEEPVTLGDGIRLWGIDDPTFFGNTNEFLESLRERETSEEAFDLLLSHRPEFAPTYAECGFELTLCGHAHGGPVRIPGLLNGLYAPNQGWLPDYAGGRYDFPNGTVIVSRGLMRNELPRVFNPPELVILHITGED